MSALPETPPLTPDRRPTLLARFALLLIGLYQRTALIRTPRCRFHPTCSQYAIESVQVHGALRGLGMAAARLARCHPWHPGGFDPVTPPRRTESDS